MRAGGGVPRAQQSGRKRADLAPRPAPQLWGVLNVTPDSFSDGGAFLALDAALARAERMLADGAHVIDVGGESSRPAGRTYGQGADVVSEAEELRRVLPVIERLRALGATISVDTVKPQVARAALAAGAAIVNDVSCGRSVALLEAVAEAGAELVLMHNRGRGERSGANVVYGDVVGDVAGELAEALERAVRAGVSRERVWLDPGLGFAKTAAQSLTLLSRLSELLVLGQRVLLGASRKSFLGEAAPLPTGGLSDASQRLGGSLAAACLATAAGCHALRVHDVFETRQATLVMSAAREACAC